MSYFTESKLYSQLFAVYQSDEFIADIADEDLFDLTKETIINDDDLIAFINNCEYWQVKHLPFFVYDYVRHMKCDFAYVADNVPHGHDNLFVQELKLADKVYCRLMGSFIAEDAAKNGFTGLLKYLHSVIDIDLMDDCDDLLECAIEADQFDCMKYLLQHIKPDCHTVEIATGHANLNCLSYLLDEHNCAWDGRAIVHAAVEGNLNAIKYLSNAKQPSKGIDYKDAMVGAILNDNFECLEYLHSLNKKYICELCNCALIKDNIRCLMFLHDKGYPMGKSSDYNCDPDDAYESDGDNWSSDGIYPGLGFIQSCISNDSVKCLEYVIKNGMVLTYKHHQYSGKYRNECLKCAAFISMQLI